MCARGLKTQQIIPEIYFINLHWIKCGLLQARKNLQEFLLLRLHISKKRFLNLEHWKILVYSLLFECVLAEIGSSSLIDGPISFLIVTNYFQDDSNNTVLNFCKRCNSPAGLSPLRVLSYQWKSLCWIFKSCILSEGDWQWEQNKEPFISLLLSKAQAQ